MQHESEDRTDLSTNSSNNNLNFDGKKEVNRTTQPLPSENSSATSNNLHLSAQFIANHNRLPTAEGRQEQDDEEEVDEDDEDQNRYRQLSTSNESNQPNRPPMYAHHASRADLHGKKQGLRKGKWTPEEEKYTNKVIEVFNAGLLKLGEHERGITLRAYLAEKLHCDPMRITKKYTGASCLGKRVYHFDYQHADLMEAERARQELQHLDNSFRLKLEQITRNHHQSLANFTSNSNHHHHNPKKGSEASGVNNNNAMTALGGGYDHLLTGTDAPGSTNTLPLHHGHVGLMNHHGPMGEEAYRISTPAIDALFHQQHALAAVNAANHGGQVAGGMVMPPGYDSLAAMAAVYRQHQAYAAAMAQNGGGGAAGPGGPNSAYLYGQIMKEAETVQKAANASMDKQQQRNGGQQQQNGNANNAGPTPQTHPYLYMNNGNYPAGVPPFYYAAMAPPPTAFLGGNNSNVNNSNNNNAVMNNVKKDVMTNQQQHNTNTHQNHQNNKPQQQQQQHQSSSNPLFAYPPGTILTAHANIGRVASWKELEAALSAGNNNNNGQNYTATTSSSTTTAAKPKGQLAASVASTLSPGSQNQNQNQQQPVKKQRTNSIGSGNGYHLGLYQNTTKTSPSMEFQPLMALDENELNQNQNQNHPQQQPKKIEISEHDHKKRQLLYWDSLIMSIAIVVKKI